MDECPNQVLSAWCIGTAIIIILVGLVYTYLLTYLLTYSMEHSLSWEANQLSASQEIPHILCNPNAHYRIHLSLSWASSIQVGRTKVSVRYGWSVKREMCSQWNVQRIFDVNLKEEDRFMNTDCSRG